MSPFPLSATLDLPDKPQTRVEEEPSYSRSTLVPVYPGVIGLDRGPATTDIKNAHVRHRFDLGTLRGLDLNQRTFGYEVSACRDVPRRSPMTAVT